MRFSSIERVMAFHLQFLLKRFVSPMGIEADFAVVMGQRPVAVGDKPIHPKVGNWRIEWCRDRILVRFNIRHPYLEHERTVGFLEALTVERSDTGRAG